MNLYTEGEYLNRNPTYHVEDSAWKAEHIAMMLARNKVVPATVCEVGCGAGAILGELQQRFPNAAFCGYEVSPQAIELCKARANDRLKFVLGDFSSMKTEFYDLVLCIDVIEHVDDYASFLKRLKDKGAYKLFHIPLEISLYKNLMPGRLRKSTERFGHIHFFNRATALAALRDAGYEVIDSFYTPGGIDCGRTLEARLGRIPIKFISFLSAGLAARLFGAHSLMALAR